MTVSRKIYLPNAEKKFQQVKLQEFTWMPEDIWYLTDSHVLCANRCSQGFATIKPFRSS